MRAYPDWQGDKCKEKESALKHITSNMVESMLWHRHVWLRLEFTDDVSTFRNRRMNSGVHGAPLSAHIQINAPMMFNSAIWTKWLRFKIYEGRYTESNLQMLCHCLNTWLIYIFLPSLHVDQIRELTLKWRATEPKMHNLWVQHLNEYRIQQYFFHIWYKSDWAHSATFRTMYSCISNQSSEFYRTTF